MNGMKLLQALLMLVICVRVDFSLLIRTKYGTEGFSLGWQNDFAFHCGTFDKGIIVNRKVE